MKFNQGTALQNPPIPNEETSDRITRQMYWIHHYHYQHHQSVTHHKMYLVYLHEQSGLSSIKRLFRLGSIAILAVVTSPIVINVPPRGFSTVKTKILLFCGWQNLNIKRLVCKQ